MGEKRRPRVGSRWRSDWTGRVTEYVVEEHTPGQEWEYRLTGYREGCTPFADACGLDALQKWQPMSACPWESDASAPPSAATGSSAAPTQNHRADQVQNEDAVKRNVVPGTKPYMHGNGEARPKVRVGQIYDTEIGGHCTVGKVYDEGGCSIGSMYFETRNGVPLRGGRPLTLIRDVEEPDPGLDRVTLNWGNEPGALVRPGQRWSDGRHEYAFLDEDGGTFLARRDDGLRVLVPRSRVVECAWRLVSGPVEVETDREALERVVKLEAEYPAAGETAGTWLRKLLATAENQAVTPIGIAGFRVRVRDARGNVGPWNAMTLEEAGR